MRGSQPRIKTSIGRIAALRAQHCDQIFREKASGKDVKNRPQLERAILW
jgi:hypothetical protein